MTTTSKLCPKCKQDKPASEFYRQKATKTGLSGYCKTCTRDWGRENRDKVSRKNAKHYAANKERMCERAKEYREQNPEQHRAAVESYREQHPEKVRSYRVRYNREHRREIRQYRVKTREHAREYRRAYAAAKPHVLRAKTARYRSRKKSVQQGDKALVDAFYKRVASAKRIRCYWCNKPVRKADRHVDHIVPLAKRGPHAVENMCCSCSACNTAKRDVAPEEFSGQFQILFPVTK